MVYYRYTVCVGRSHYPCYCNELSNGKFNVQVKQCKPIKQSNKQWTVISIMVCKIINTRQKEKVTTCQRRHRVGVEV